MFCGQETFGGQSSGVNERYRSTMGLSDGLMAHEAVVC